MLQKRNRSLINICNGILMYTVIEKDNGLRLIRWIKA